MLTLQTPSQIGVLTGRFERPVSVSHLLLEALLHLCLRSSIFLLYLIMTGSKQSKDRNYS